MKGAICYAGFFYDKWILKGTGVGGTYSPICDNLKLNFEFSHIIRWTDSDRIPE